ncbi:hypothetical protein [Agrobacterium salinitolerans]|uniref:hypothetical protein n=1 Tax=Agrobacterium salinitolerans TaxID=1183413 RepID=UPI0022B8A04C|nr:hypothetical protein [Agrobacterium salinitolerans]MCZ7853727.1 hypothetical protein [Agrobacterium salinitolerans]
MAYYVDELLDHTGKSLGWFVFYANGDIFLGPYGDEEANNFVYQLNRDEPIPDLMPSGQREITVDLYNAEGFFGTAVFDEYGRFVPGTFKRATVQATASVSSSGIGNPGA